MGLTRPITLTIAGCDSSGGAGVVADLKTFEALGAWGTVCVTAVTAQNSLGVTASHLVPPEMILAQMAAVADDLGVDAAKTGMLGSAAAVGAVATGIRRAGIGLVVVDPVLVSKHGDALLAADALDADRVVKAALPGEMYRVFSHYKRDEWERFISTVSEWDVQEYLDVLP